MIYIQRIYSYEKILEIAKIHFNDQEIIQTSKRLLKLYPKDEILKKSIIYYDLSMMDIDIAKQRYYVEKGLALIIGESTNPSFFEIQYKLKRRRNELLGVEEELLEAKDSSLGLRSNLEKLSLVNKNYKGEYQQIALKERYKDIIKQTSKRTWFGIILTLLTIAFLLFIVFNLPKSMLY